MTKMTKSPTRDKIEKSAPPAKRPCNKGNASLTQTSKLLDLLKFAEYLTMH